MEAREPISSTTPELAVAGGPATLPNALSPTTGPGAVPPGRNGPGGTDGARVFWPGQRTGGGPGRSEPRSSTGTMALKGRLAAAGVEALAEFAARRGTSARRRWVPSRRLCRLLDCRDHAGCRKAQGRASSDASGARRGPSWPPRRRRARPCGASPRTPRLFPQHPPTSERFLLVGLAMASDAHGSGSGGSNGRLTPVRVALSLPRMNGP